MGDDINNRLVNYLIHKPKDQVIDRFEEYFSFLSNDEPSWILYENLLFPSVSVAFQAARASDFETKQKISEVDSPDELIEIAQGIEDPQDWESKRLNVMEILIRDKFRRSLEMRERLRLTEEKYEEESQSNLFWGFVGNKGQNQIGRILERVRADIVENSDLKKWLLAKFPIEKDKILLPVITLNVHKGEELIETITLKDRSYYYMGQYKTNSVLLAHPSISRLHACLICEVNNQVRLVDMESKSGSFVNGEMLEKLHDRELKSGDILTFALSTRSYQIAIDYTQAKIELHKRNIQLQQQVKQLQKLNQPTLSTEELRRIMGFDIDDTLFISGLPPNANVITIQKLFSEIAKVKEVKIPVDKWSGKQRGFAYVVFQTKEDFSRAFLHSMNLKYDEHKLKVKIADKEKSSQLMNICRIDEERDHKKGRNFDNFKSGGDHKSYYDRRREKDAGNNEDDDNENGGDKFRRRRNQSRSRSRSDDNRKKYNRDPVKDKSNKSDINDFKSDSRKYENKKNDEYKDSSVRPTSDKQRNRSHSKEQDSKYKSKNDKSSDNSNRRTRRSRSPIKSNKNQSSKSRSRDRKGTVNEAQKDKRDRDSKRDRDEKRDRSRDRDANKRDRDGNKRERSRERDNRKDRNIDDKRERSRDREDRKDKYERKDRDDRKERRDGDDRKDRNRDDRKYKDRDDKKDRSRDRGDRRDRSRDRNQSTRDNNNNNNKHTSLKSSNKNDSNKNNHRSSSVSKKDTRKASSSQNKSNNEQKSEIQVDKNQKRSDEQINNTQGDQDFRQSQERERKSFEEKERISQDKIINKTQSNEKNQKQKESKERKQKDKVEKKKDNSNKNEKKDKDRSEKKRGEENKEKRKQQQEQQQQSRSSSSSSSSQSGSSRSSSSSSSQSSNSSSSSNSRSSSFSVSSNS